MSFIVHTVGLLKMFGVHYRTKPTAPPHRSGAYGRIQLCRHKPTNEVVVLKTVKMNEVRNHVLRVPLVTSTNAALC